ncbi:LamG-like jellyroll fold domain-containing protein [Flavobacterium sp.]|uniref:LamG-like jellyroll fold domain-containing protein n=1 Tax=Flavobacterium sp. TaxID=239 RepID=UPI003A8E5CC0
MNRKILSRSNLFRSSLLTFLFASNSLQAQNTGMEFDGINDYIQTDYAGISGNASRTVEAWIKVGSDSAQRFLVDMGDTGTGAGARFSFKINPSANVIRIEIGGGGLNGTTYITDNQWHHVAVVYNDDAATNKYSLYVDGELDVQGDLTTTLNVQPLETNLTIGIRADLSASTVWDGAIDDVRVWDIARTQEDIEADMDTEFCTAQTNLVTYFKLNDGLAGSDNTGITNVTDDSGNAYVGTLNGFSLTGTGSNFVSGPTNLAPEAIDMAISTEGTTITVGETDATYQWVDCNNDDTPIDGATNQSFIPEVSGNYAVIVTNGNCSWQSDCIEVTVDVEACTAPSAIEISEITASTAMVSWTESGDATQWEVIYGPTGFDLETEGETVTIDTTAEVTLADLTAITGYDVYVRAVCGTDFTSEWTGPQAFTTLEDVVETGDGIALTFEGTDDYIQTDYAGITGGGARTVEAWIKTDKNSLPENQGGDGQSVIVDWGTLGTGTRFTFNILFNNAIRLEVQGSGLSGNIAVNDNLWHHVAVVYDPTATNKVKLYVDGVLDVEGNLTVSVNTGTVNDVKIGGRIDDVNFFDGSMDEVRIWNVARTQEEIAANMATEFCGIQPNLTAYFKLNEGTPEADNTAVTMAMDDSGNGYTGTFMDFTLSGLTSNYGYGAVEVNETEVDNTVTLVDVTITAAQADAIYQWVDCNDNNALIEDATSQSFTAVESGNYAVMITANGCTVLSDCTEIVLESEVCAAPSAIEISEITASTAMVSWTENGEATQWEVLYGPAGFNIETEGTSVIVDDIAEVVLEELDADTEYHVYVRAVCGEDFTSEWGGQQAFVTLEETTCAAPSAIEISEITASTAMVSWTENGEATQWEVLYGPAGFNIETEGTLITVNDIAEVVLEELDSDTEYHVYVRAVCSEDFTSEWEGQQAFVTLEEATCAAPSAIEISEITASTAMVSWTENGEATQWEVLYGPAGFNIETEGTSVTVNDVAEVGLEELDSDTEYHVYVRAVCGEEMTSSLEGPEAFSTQLLGLNDNAIKGFVLYPNPTTGIVRINAQDIIENVAVYNLAGQKLTEVEVNAAASQINLSQLPVGVYVMQVTASGKTGTYKIAIK